MAKKRPLGSIDGDAALKDFAEAFPSTTPAAQTSTANSSKDNEQPTRPSAPTEAANPSPALAEAAPQPPASAKAANQPPAPPEAASESSSNHQTSVAQQQSQADHPLTVRIPQYVAKSLRLAYAETGKTQRVIVLEALKKWGIAVHDEDLVERRRKGEP